MKLEIIRHPCEDVNNNIREDIQDSCRRELKNLQHDIDYNKLLSLAETDSGTSRLMGKYQYLFYTWLWEHSGLSGEQKKNILQTLLKNHPIKYINWDIGEKSQEYREVLETHLTENMLLSILRTESDVRVIFYGLKNIEPLPWGRWCIEKIIEKYPEVFKDHVSDIVGLRHGTQYIVYFWEKFPNRLLGILEKLPTEKKEIQNLIRTILESKNPSHEAVLRNMENLMKLGFQESIRVYLKSQNENLKDSVEENGYGLKQSLDLWKEEPWAKSMILALIARNNSSDPDRYIKTILEGTSWEEYMKAYIRKGTVYAFILLPYYRDLPWAKKVHLEMVEDNPRIGFSYYREYMHLPYGNEMFEISLKSDPYSGMTFLYERSDLRKRFDKDLPILLGNIRSRINKDIESESNNKSLQIVRIINMLHEEKSEVRFAILKDVKPENLYRLIVLGRSEVFTSTYNGIFRSIESSGVKISQILESVKYSWIHIFFEAVSSYGDLSKLLKDLSPNDLEKILEALFTEEFSKNRLENSVAMMEIITNIQDTTILQQIQRKIRENINQENGEVWKVIAKYFSRIKKEFMIPVFQELDKKYELPNLASIKSSEMFWEETDPTTGEKKKTNIQQYYFYNDKDGSDSYKNFLATARLARWIVDDKWNYVVLSKTGKNGTIKIYANKPESEKKWWEELKKLNIKPSIVVHRWHSYHAQKTIEDIHDNPRMVFLGSCGGFQNIWGVLRKSPNAHIISTKWVWTMLVNDPLFENINTSLLDQDTIVWEKIWKNIDVRIWATSNEEVKKNFEKYMRPDRNLWTLFYQRIQSL